MYGRLIVPLVLMLAPAAAAPGGEPAGRPGSLAYHVERIAPHIHMFTQGDTFHAQPYGNVEVIEQSDGMVLVDSGGSPAAADEVIAFLRARATAPVKAVVLTHWHGDHVLGVSRILEVWPQARIIATAETRDMLADPKVDRFMPGSDPSANQKFLDAATAAVRGMRRRSEDSKLDEAMRQHWTVAAQEMHLWARAMRGAHRTVPTETFSGSLDIPDEIAPVRVMFLGRANTSGDAVVWLPVQKVVITGDIVVRPIPYGFNSYPREWRAVLEHLADLHARVILPGHGEPMRSNAYVGLLSSMLADVRRQVAAFASDASITDEQAAARVDLSAAEQKIAGGDPWLRDWFDRYWKTPIVSSALREARGQPVVQGDG